MESYYVATFYSTSQALRFEKMLASQTLTVQMIPVPRVLSSSCGLAARFAESVWPAVQKMVAANVADAEEVYLFTIVGKKTQAERVWYK